jgi:hypothetical protein
MALLLSILCHALAAAMITSRCDNAPPDYLFEFRRQSVWLSRHPFNKGHQIAAKIRDAWSFAFASIQGVLRLAFCEPPRLEMPSVYAASASQNTVP